MIDVYPNHAGYTEPTTSRDAAEALELSGTAARLRVAVEQYYALGNIGTADDCAEALGESILSIRPRCSELRTRGKLVTTGERRRSAGGRMASVLRAA
jgi:hypothetical protein